MKCTADPPKALYHPVLPYKTRGKLLFPLCRTCADTCQDICNHDATERAITVTWTMPELNKAIEKGYKLRNILEIWHYKDTAAYGDEKYPKGLFGGYVNAMLKTKQEASGWPENVNTMEERDNFVKAYQAKEGIKLTKENIAANPGKRSLAKIMLNRYVNSWRQLSKFISQHFFSKMRILFICSLWGKFGKRETLPKTEYAISRHRLLELITS